MPGNGCVIAYKLVHSTALHVTILPSAFDLMLLSMPPYLVIATQMREAQAALPLRSRSVVNAAAYDIANEPTSSLADFVDKLRFARRDVAECGVTDRCVLVLPG